MRKLSILICVFLCGAVLAAGFQPAGSVEVYFSPSNACEESIVKMINGSRREIDVAVYSLNNADIVEALKEADRRGVKVRILTDRLQAAGRSSKVRELYRAGVNIRVHSKHKIEHNKFAVFDGETAVTGSYNWTEPATGKNSENCIFFHDGAAVAAFSERFVWLWSVNTKEKSDRWFAKKEALAKAD